MHTRDDGPELSSLSQSIVHGEFALNCATLEFDGLPAYRRDALCNSLERKRSDDCTGEPMVKRLSKKCTDRKQKYLPVARVGRDLESILSRVEYRFVRIVALVEPGQNVQRFFGIGCG